MPFPNISLPSYYCNPRRTAVAKSRQEFKDGVLKSKNLSQSFVLERALDIDHGEVAEVTLDVLLNLAPSVVFRRIWKKAAAAVRREIQLDADDTMASDEQLRKYKRRMVMAAQERQGFFVSKNIRTDTSSGTLKLVFEDHPALGDHSEDDGSDCDVGTSNSEDDELSDDEDCDSSISDDEDSERSGEDIDTVDDGEWNAHEKDSDRLVVDCKGIIPRIVTVDGRVPDGERDETTGEGDSGEGRDGTAPRRTQKRHGSAASAEATPERSLPLSAVLRHVIPAARGAWNDLSDRISARIISAHEAWKWLGEGFSTQQRAAEVRLMLSSPTCKEVTTACPQVGIAVSRRRQQQKQQQILEALAAHASVKWCMDAIPALLQAQEVLYTVSSARSNAPGGEGEEAVTPGTVNESDSTSSSPAPMNNNPPPEQSETTPESIDGSLKVAEEGHGIDLPSGSSLTQIFATAPEDDATRAELQNIMKDLRKKQARHSLLDAAQAWKRVTAWGRGDGLLGKGGGGSKPKYSGVGRGVLSGLEAAFTRQTDKSVPRHLSRVHIGMLQKLSESPALVGWLIQVCVAPEV